VHAHCCLCTRSGAPRARARVYAELSHKMAKPPPPSIFAKALAAREQEPAAPSPTKAARPSYHVAPAAMDDNAAAQFAAEEDSAPQPLSRAERLRAELASKVPQQESKYVAQLMEVAKKRKLAQEEAFTRKFLREQAEEEAISGPATEKFITQGYEERLQERKAFHESEAQSDSSRDAGQFRNNLLNSLVGEPSAPTAAAQRPVVGGATAPHRRAGSHAAVDSETLRRQQAHRREARRAPPSQLTPEIITRARLVIEARQLLPWA